MRSRKPRRVATRRDFTGSERFLHPVEEGLEEPIMNRGDERVPEHGGSQ